MWGLSAEEIPGLELWVRVLCLDATVMDEISCRERAHGEETTTKETSLWNRITSGMSKIFFLICE